VLDLLARFRNHHIGQHIFARCLAGIPQYHSCALQVLLGNTNELAVFPGLLLLTLPRRHPLDLLHPTPRRSRSILETPDTPAFHRRREAFEQACDDAHHILHNSESRIIPRRPGTSDISGISGARISELLEAA
jgi:hypothetical protein